MQTSELLREIRESDVAIIDDILYAAMVRKRELYPDWEFFYCSAEKEKINGPEDMIRVAWEFDQRLKRNDE